ncbi:unnamed protein product [Camellia sinensis]
MLKRDGVGCALLVEATPQDTGVIIKSSIQDTLGQAQLGLDTMTDTTNLLEPAFFSNELCLRSLLRKCYLNFVYEMPKLETQIKIDLASILGPLFFTWVILQLLPVILTSLAYEKQQKLRIMMKMHGFGDGPYWMITYAYFLVIYLAYMLCFVLFGSVIGLKFFTLNDYNIQFVFYFIYVNLQISLAFLVASIFANVKTAAGLLSGT